MEPMTTAAAHHRIHLVGRMVLWLGMLTLLVTPVPAAAGWLPWSIARGRTQTQSPTDSKPNYLRTQNHSIIAVGSTLHAYDQCGGIGGLCNSTTIGIPCGDHQWDGVYCPENFECSRRSVSVWRCLLIPGRKPDPEQQRYMETHADPDSPNKSNNATSSKTASNKGRTRDRTSREALPRPDDTEIFRSSDRGRDMSNKRAPINQMSTEGPIVPVCGPAQLAGRGVAMCNKTMNGFFVNSSAVSSAESVSYSWFGSSSLLGSISRLAAALLAALAVHALAAS